MQNVLTTAPCPSQVRLASYGLPLLEATGLTTILGAHSKHIA